MTFYLICYGRLIPQVLGLISALGNFRIPLTAVTLMQGNCYYDKFVSRIESSFVSSTQDIL